MSSQMVGRGISGNQEGCQRIWEHEQKFSLLIWALPFRAVAQATIVFRCLWNKPYVGGVTTSVPCIFPGWLASFAPDPNRTGAWRGGMLGGKARTNYDRISWTKTLDRMPKRQQTFILLVNFVGNITALIRNVRMRSMQRRTFIKNGMQCLGGRSGTAARSPWKQIP